MQNLCRRAPFWSFYRYALLLTWLLIALLPGPLLAESGRPKDDFPPEVDYPEEAYEAEDDGKKVDRKKKRTVPERFRPRVERTPLPEEEPSGPKLWSYSADLLVGLNQIVPTIDPKREEFFLVQSFLIGGRLGILRGNWGIEFDGRYAFTPEQSRIDEGSGNVLETRLLTYTSLHLNAVYQYRTGGPNGRYLWAFRAGYASVSISQQIGISSEAGEHAANIGSVFLGMGVTAQWLRWWSTQLDFNYGLLNSGSLAPNNVSGSGYGLWSAHLYNRVRLMSWGENESKGMGFGLLATVQKLTTPPPPSGNFVGGSETAIQFLGTAYLMF